MSDDSRIIPLTNGRAPRSKGGDYITRAQSEQLAQAVFAEAEKMVKWYMEQIPGLVARMLGDALAVNGLVMKSPDDIVAPVVLPDASGDTATADSTETVQ